MRVHRDTVQRFLYTARAARCTTSPANRQIYRLLDPNEKFFSPGMTFAYWGVGLREGEALFGSRRRLSKMS